MEQKKLEKYKDWIFRISAYRMALAAVNFDQQTIAPVGGNAYRDARCAFLSGELFDIQTEPEILAIIKELKDDETADPDDRKAACPALCKTSR